MEKKTISVELLSREAHVSQIATGYCMLARKNPDWAVDTSVKNGLEGAFVRVHYDGKIIIYDMLDGYQLPEQMQKHLENCDFYFKRSFSPEKNQVLFPADLRARMYPLGFNYHVSCPGHPLDKPNWKENIKKILGIENNQWSSTYFTADKFETSPAKKEIPTVLFMTRLWDGAGDSEECNYINNMRIDIIRSLKEMSGIRFIGGLTDTGPARKLASELLLPHELTARKKYLKTLRACDICIGSMGLHESIGWKTGEYVAAEKAIVNERFHYQVPGDFAVGKNYLEFDSAEKCIAAVRELVESPEKCYEMKLANQAYYQRYLRPDALIQNTLDIVNGKESL